MRFTTMPYALNVPNGERYLVARVTARSRNGTRITSTMYPDHVGKVLAYRMVYAASAAEAWRA